MSGAVIWQELAACASGAYDPEDWHPVAAVGRSRKGESRLSPATERALSVCARCPVREPCLDYGLARSGGGALGIWGGLILGTSRPGDQLTEEQRASWAHRWQAGNEEADYGD